MVENYEDFFEQRGETPRKSQVQALNFLEQELERNGKTFAVVDAPTGCGKSHVALAVGNENRIFVLSSTKQLQDQYLKLAPDAVLVKGKANYPCGLNGHLNCENGFCSTNPKVKKFCLKRGICPYYSQVEKAFGAQVVVANYDFFIYATHCGCFAPQNFKSEDSWYAKVHRDVMVCDEAHVLEDKIVSFAEITLDVDAVGREFDISFSPDIQFVYEGMYQSKNLVSLKSAQAAMVEKCKHYKSVVDSVLSKYSDDIENTGEMPKMDQEDERKVASVHKKLYDIDKLVQKMRVFFDNFMKNRWVYNVESPRRIYLAPLRVSGLFSTYFRGFASKFVLMSATIGDSKEFVSELGLEEDQTACVEVQSDFDPAASPIVYLPVGKMSMANIEETLPRVASAVDSILKTHRNEKGIIHSVTYRIADYIYRNTSETSKKRLIYSRAEVWKKSNHNMYLDHCDTDEPTVLLSPSMHEGVSLDGDLSRFQIIAKLPFLSLDNFRTSVKSRISGKWYLHKMAVNLMQASGRSTRSKDDYSVTYVLDQSFKYFFKRMEYDVPDWFALRVQMK